MENNERCWPAELLWKQMIDIKTDGMVVKKKNTKPGEWRREEEVWEEGRQGLDRVQNRSDTDHKAVQWVCTLHGTRVESSPQSQLWWQTWLTASGWGSRVLSVGEAFPVDTGIVLHVTRRWGDVQNARRFKWQASCKGQNTFCEPFKSSHLPSTISCSWCWTSGSQEFPAWR